MSSSSIKIYCNSIAFAAVTQTTTNFRSIPNRPHSGMGSSTIHINISLRKANIGNFHHLNFVRIYKADTANSLGSIMVWLWRKLAIRRSPNLVSTVHFLFLKIFLLRNPILALSSHSLFFIDVPSLLLCLLFWFLPFHLFFYSFPLHPSSLPSAAIIAFSLFSVLSSLPFAFPSSVYLPFLWSTVYLHFL